MYTVRPNTTGVASCGEPRYHDHRCLPVSASTPKIVHENVLKTQMPSSHAGSVGPSSDSRALHRTRPVPASNAWTS